MATMTSNHVRDRTSDRLVQEFIRWINEHSEPGYNSGSAASFMPFPALSDYLGSNKNQVLRALLNAKYCNESHTEGPVPAQEIISTGRLKIFCILLFLGRDELDALKHFTPFDNLKDDSLPFEPSNCPRHFPHISGKPNFFEDFCATQWKFCAPSIVYNSDREFYASEILPMISKVEIKSGRSAKIYKIKLHEQYNSLIDTQGSNPDEHSPLVLKTYYGRSARRFYDREVAAFRYVKNQCPYIVRFYGAFKHGDTYNVLLEHADLGSLDDYWAAVTPPIPGKTMISLWNSCFGLIRALRELQNGDEIFWHQDVKPANILIMRSGVPHGASQNGCIFKLADFGNSHMRSQSVIGPLGTDQDSRGTRTYGAPECYRPDDFLGEGKLRVAPNVDMWSLGCIISEFAVWLYFGVEGLNQYSDARVSECKTIPGFQGGNCFHNGHERLRSVEVWHDKVREKLVESDTTTKDVLVLAEDMLCAEVLRGTAHSYCIKAYEIQCRSLRTFRERFPDDEIEPGMLPPSRPPEPARESVRNIPISELPRPRSPGLSSHIAVARPNLTAQTSYPRGTIHSHSGSLPAIMEPHDSSPEYSTPTGRQRASLPVPVRRSPSSGSQRNNLDYGIRGGMSSHPETPTQNFEQQRLPHWENFKSTVSISPNPFSRASYSSPIGSPASPFGPQLGTQHLATPIEPRPSTALPLASRRPLVLHNLSEESHHSLSEVPYIGIEEAEKWRKDNKLLRHKDRKPLRDSRILNELDNRDSILIIDDSKSMEEHHSDVTRLFSIMSYIIKARDTTGLDLVFASKLEIKHNNLHTTPLTTLVASQEFAGITNLSLVMDSVLDEYGRKLKNSHIAQSLPKLNLYIFTDGLWRSQCDVVPAIDKIVQTMIAVHAPQNQIGIQFISFGSDPVGLARLALLDNGLDLKFDIIDTTPSNDNLYKMIMGAIDKDLDHKAEGTAPPLVSTSE